MKIQLIRNATLKIHYGGHVFLIDPYLGKKHTQPPFAGISKNPTVNVPFSAKEILNGTDVIFISHLHPDHFDEAAEKIISKNHPIVCQLEDLDVLKSKGFTNVEALITERFISEVRITRTPGQHGHGKRLQMMGKVSGYIFEHPKEPTLYWMGDTIWYQEVQDIVQLYTPDVIVTHSCGAIWKKGELPVIMDDKQTIAVCTFAPYAKVIATHMEALDLATVSRNELRKHADVNMVSDSQLIIPRDGEQIIIDTEDESNNNRNWQNGQRNYKGIGSILPG
ncbi:MAG: MBL fold metallo-hydrolase [Pricia sp.]|nr:MBL fold metallo-hydrolase [Pricia sp.]